MDRSQWYIGAVNAVVLCVDQTSDGEAAGRLYQSYSTRERTFHSMEEVVFLLEGFFDSLNFPHPTTKDRSFGEQKQYHNQKRKKERIMKDEVLLSKHGDLGTFIIRVQHRQNSSWQGRLTWMEKNRTVYFRSVWEMVKLMESALDTVSEQDRGSDMPSWFDDED